MYGSGEVRRGKLTIRQSDVLSAQLSRLRDGPVEIRITRKRATRSQQQNRYYWGVVVALIAEHTGYTAEETHTVLKQRFLPKRLAMANRNGEIVGEYVIGGSTAALSLGEFTDYLEQIKDFALTELDVAIPNAEGDGWQ